MFASNRSLRRGVVLSNYFYFVFTRPKTGQDEEFNHWYSKRHIFDLVAIPGIAAARRYRLLDTATKAETPDYLAIYEFSDVDLAISGIAERRGTDRMPSTEAIDRDASKGVVFKPLWEVPGDWRFGSGVLDLIKFDGPVDAALLNPEVGVLVANHKQSRPGPPVFDVAFFTGDEGTKNNQAVPSADYRSRLSAMMSPITERVTAS
jgi:hypothetical protein